eukprot:976712-Prorocentrum_lima.AAC.1
MRPRTAIGGATLLPNAANPSRCGRLSQGWAESKPSRAATSAQLGKEGSPLSPLASSAPLRIISTVKAPWACSRAGCKGPPQSHGHCR